MGAIDRAQSYITTTLPGTLSTLYASILPRAPLPRSPSSATRGSSTATTATSSRGSRRPRSRASTRPPTCSTASSPPSPRARASPSPIRRPPSSGTPSATGREWINGLSNPISESYHPKVVGHSSGYLPVVSPFVTGSSVRMTAAIRTAATASAGRLAAQQRTYAAADRSIRPEVFRAPDLTTPAARAAAARAGWTCPRARASMPPTRGMPRSRRRPTALTRSGPRLADPDWLTRAGCGLVGPDSQGSVSVRAGTGRGRGRA